MAIQFHVGAGQTYATVGSAVTAIAALYGSVWPSEPVDLIVHGTVDEGAYLSIVGFTPTLANPFTIRGYTGRDYDRGIIHYLMIGTAHTRFRDITEQSSLGDQIEPSGSALSTTLRFSRVKLVGLDVETYQGIITGEILLENCLQIGSLWGILNLRYNTVVSTGGLCIVRNCISDNTIFSSQAGVEINGGNVIIDNNTAMNGPVVNTLGYVLTFTAGGLYIRNNIAKRASGLLVDFGPSVVVPTVMNKNRYSHQVGAFRVGGVTYNTIADWRTAISGDANSTVGDPGIDSNGRLLSSSVCIGAGLDLHADALSPFDTDYDGQSRPS